MGISLVKASSKFVSEYPMKVHHNFSVQILGMTFQFLGNKEKELASGYEYGGGVVISLRLAKSCGINNSLSDSDFYS